MGSLRETIMEHIKNKEFLNPTQVSVLEDNLSHIVSQFHTPDHPPYAAMIHRAIVELKQKGGSTEKSISEFIRREYDDLPWAHCSLLKHHLGLLAKHGEINVSRGFRYSVCGAGSSKSSIKGGKKNRRKKWKWKFDRKRTKRLKLVIRVNDLDSQVAGIDVIETENVQNGLQTPKQEGTVPFQLTDGGEDEAMDIDPPSLMSTDECENQVGIDQKQQDDGPLKLYSTSDLEALQLNGSNSNEDVIPELSSPERPPGFEFMGVELSTHTSEKKEKQREALPTPSAEELENADVPSPSEKKEQLREALSTPIAEELEKSDVPSPSEKKEQQTEALSTPIAEELEKADVPSPSEKKEKQREALSAPIAEELEKADLPCPLQPIREKKQEKKKGKHPELRQLEIMVAQNEIVLALPHAQNGSPMQNDRSRRQLKRWSGDLPDVSHTVNVLSSSENSEKCPPVEITSNVDRTQVLKKLPSKFTIITRRNAKVNSSQTRFGARPQPESVSLCPSMDLQQDEDIPLKKYQRRSRRPKDTAIQDESPLADNQKQQADKSPNLRCYHILQEKASEASLPKEEFTLPTNKDNSEKDNQLEPSKPRLRDRHPKRNLNVNEGKDDQSSTRNKLKKFSHHRARKIQKKC